MKSLSKYDFIIVFLVDIIHSRWKNYEVLKKMHQKKDKKTLNNDSLKIFINSYC